jgi:hydroxyacylglutathione hydrolase
MPKRTLPARKRVAAFVKDRSLSHVLGGHIELDAAGETFPGQSQYHPNEHALELSKDDLLALPAALSSFNGFYSRSGKFILSNPVHNLIAVAVLSGVVLLAFVLTLVRYIRRRKSRRKQRAAVRG